MDRKPAPKSQKIVNSTMWRNIFGQGIYQLIILMTMLCFGAQIFGFTVNKGDPFYYNDDWIADAKEAIIAKDGSITQTQIDTLDGMVGTASEKCELYTMVFQAFVFMQLFNQFNARKLGEKEYNICASI